MRADGRRISEYRTYLAPTLTIFAVTAFSILLHTKWCSTPMLSTEEHWHMLFGYHFTFYPFSIRYFTTFLVQGMHGLTGLPIKETFFAVQYLLSAVVALVLYRFLLRLRLSRGWAHFGMFLFLVSFPIIFAHSEPVFTWDDGWTYLFLLLCTMSLMNCRLWSATVCFVLGCFAREQMMLYFPVYLLGINTFCVGRSKWSKILAAVLPVIIYGAFYAALFEAPEQKRFELLQYNFETLPRTANSLFSLFIAFGAIWVAWLFSVRSFLRKGRVDAGSRELRFLAWGSLLAVAPTLFLGLVLALARETRIFFPPFVFIIPLAVVWLQERMRMVDKGRRKQRLWMALATAGAIIAGISLIGNIKPDLDYRNCPDFCYLWAGTHIGLSIGVILFAIVTGKSQKPVDEPKATIS
jgi:hypothetical protein